MITRKHMRAGHQVETITEIIGILEGAVVESVREKNDLTSGMIVLHLDRGPDAFRLASLITNDLVPQVQVAQSAQEPSPETGTGGNASDGDDGTEEPPAEGELVDPDEELTGQSRARMDSEE